MLLEKNNKDLAVYIHWPFCKSKCPYCSFNSYVREDVNQKEILKYYLEELKHYKFLLGDKNITSIYFGGGTPSLMDNVTVDAILKEIGNIWHIEPDAEITLEANPTSIEYSKFESFRKLGINRLSIGVQSFSQNNLKYLGRQHSVDDAIKSLEIAANLFDRYSFDLIYAVEYQTLAEWKSELEVALSYSGGHVSLYQLSIDDSTKFHSLYKKGQIRKLEENISADMFELTQEIMDKHSMPAYEVSNHAKKGQESKHNLTYWHYKDYIGIGAGAHGRITIDGKKVAISNLQVPEQWMKRVSDPVSEVVGVTEELYEELLMGLRLYSGIEWRDDFLNVIDNQKLNELIDKRLIVREDNNIRVSKKGMEILNSVLGYIL